MNIAVAGTGYVGLSISALLSQNNHVIAVDVVPEKVDMINRRKSPIQDEYIRGIWQKNSLIFLRLSMAGPDMPMLILWL